MLERAHFRYLILASVIAGCGEGSGPASPVEDPGQTPADFPYVCEVTFHVSGPTTPFEEVAIYGQLDSRLGSFAFENGTARCTSSFGKVAGRDYDDANNSVNPDHPKRDFVFTVDRHDGIVMPADIFTCALRAARTPIAEDFVATAVAMLEAGSGNQDETPRDAVATVSGIHCTDAPDSTTTTTLDTCKPADCLPDGVCSAGECVAADKGRIDVVLDESATPLGALQLEIDYSDSLIAFANGGGRGACTPAPGASWLYADCNFQDAGDCETHEGFHPGELSMAVITVEPFTAPVTIASCDIVAPDIASAVAAMRLEVRVAAGPDLEPVHATLGTRIVEP
jgi:hypothetical protein